ncbi:hypothetical protein WT98_17130 [Burkholderia territorii]|nr:hypothetical protein WT98_17130 [Burkholderia territorii]
MIDILRKAWHGEEQLWKVWWLIGIPQSILLAVLYTYFLKNSQHHLPYIIATAIYIVIYFSWVRMAWLCSPNVKMRIWTTVSYVMIVLGIFNLAKTLPLT